MTVSFEQLGPYQYFRFRSFGQSQFDKANAIAVFLTWIKVSLSCENWIRILGQQKWVPLFEK